MKNTLIVFPIAFSTACSIQNSQVRKPKPAVSALCTSGASLTGASATPRTPFLGGAISYSWERFDIDPAQPLKLNEQCTGAFEFSHSEKGFAVRVLSSDRCLDFFTGAKSGDIWVWQEASEATTAGYIQLHIPNPKYASLKAVNNMIPEASERQLASDLLKSGQLVPSIQGDIGYYLQERAADAAFFCGDPYEPGVDSPDPKGCVWPQGLQPGEYQVEAIPGVSTDSDLESLVAQSDLLKSQRSTGELPQASTATLEAYQAEWVELQKLAIPLRARAWQRTVYQGDAYADSTLRKAVARAIGTYYLPDEFSQITSDIEAGFPPYSLTAVEQRYTVARDAYAEQLGKVIDRWKVVLKLMSDSKSSLTILANLPGTEGNLELRQAPLFPASGSGDASLSGVHWSLKDKFLEVSYDVSQQMLRRPIDSGAVIFLGNYPVLSLLRDNPQEDAGTMKPLPVPQPKTPAPTAPAPNCSK